jgi:polyisoprenoid-binding protein YceI
MRARRVVFLAAALPAIAAAAWLAAPGELSYRVLDSRSRLEVIVKTEGLVNHSRGLVLRARGVKGRIVYDPLHPDRSRVDLRVPVRGLEPVSPRMTQDEANEVLNFTRSTWVLDVMRWPEISFVGSGVRWGEPRGSGFHGIHCPGRLEIKGRMAQVVLDGIARVTTEGIQVIGRRYVRQRDHGIVPLKDISGVYTIKNELEVTFDIFAVPDAALELRDDEVQPPKLTERGERSGELEKKGEPPELKRGEPELRDKGSGEFTDPKYEPR